MIVDAISAADVVLVELDAGLGLRSARALAEELGPTLDAGARVAISLAGVSSISATGLRALVLLTRRAAANDGAVVFYAVPDPIVDLMDVTGFLEAIPLADDRDAALACVRATAPAGVRP